MNAIKYQAGLYNQQYNTKTHDIGFMVFQSYGNGYRLTGNTKYKNVLNSAAKTLSKRFNPKVGLIKSWDGNEKVQPVIIDNLMNLELLFWSARNGGDKNFFEIAKSHALKTARDFVRKDGSTFHLVNYNPANGKVISRTTAQGLSPNSAWSRGQAWAIYGFSIAYHETGDTSLLNTARKTADYFINNLPADNIPYWDFKLTKTKNEPRDSSAAAIAASGLLELSRLEKSASRQERYKNTAEKILTTLSGTQYLNVKKETDGVLLHGTYNKREGNFDQSTIWGDYYFLEALLKYKSANKN